MAIKVTESYPVEFVSHVSYSLLLIGIHVIAPLSRLATKRPDWPVSPTPTRARKHRFHVPQPTFLFPLETPLRLSRSMLHGWKDNSMLAKPLTACTHLASTVSQLFEPQVPKIAVFTYRSPHFCFPWRRPCYYHAMCCMDGNTTQCLLKSMRKSKNRYLYHIFVSLGTPLGKSR